MKMNEMYPSKWLSKEDVRTPIIATIQQVSREEVKGEGGNELKNVIHFAGNVKSLILNKGNASILCDAFGDDSLAWHGKQIEIYVDPNVMFAGKRTGGLRLRVPATLPTARVNGAGVWTYPEALSEAAKVGITKEQVVAELKLRGQPGWNNAACTPIVRQMIEQRLAPQTENFDADPVPEDSSIPF